MQELQQEIARISNELNILKESMKDMSEKICTLIEEKKDNICLKIKTSEKPWSNLLKVCPKINI